MSRDDGIDAATRSAQGAATDPQGSAWVSANAGSGKTYVLSRRVIRLLLRGVDPGRILCLTFTKAAASQMANRVFAELGAWTTLGDTELAGRIAELEGELPGAETMAEARRLFAKALDTPGGLKIQTIHAFCERLLHQFPFEANVAGHFEVIDDRDQKALTEEARRAVLVRAAQDPDGLLGTALATVLSLVSDTTHESSLAKFIAERDRIGAWIRQADNLDAALMELREALGLSPQESSAVFRARIVGDAAIDGAGAWRLIDRLRASGSSDQKAAERLAPYVEAADPDDRIDAYLGFFIKGDGEPYSSPVTKGVLKALPGLAETLTSECERLVRLQGRVRTAEVFESSAAMLRLADAAIDEYERSKRRRGVLDFEDLVVRTATLLARADASRWVHYKLDRGLDHILVDEAQDTSPRQWQVIAALVEEFFAGQGASDALRTLFAVGDEKQSIYSFQGAIPAWFSLTRDRLGRRAVASGYVWRQRELHLSFRSVPKVLEAVDAVFAAPAVHAGLTATPAAPIHTARRRNEPGRVTVWPAFRPPDKPDTSDWATPVDHLGIESPEVQLARRIAATVRDWIDRKAVLDAPDADGNPRPVRPGGILVLVRSRGALTDAINRELKKNGIAIAGADRLMLTEHIAIMDLMALGQVALLPEDDLSLAALLKSPLIGLDEDALYDLAHGRGEKSLWAALAEKSGEPRFAGAKAKIDAWRAAADQRDPHAFYAAILGAERGREAFLRRLGAEAEDILDEFLAQTLAYEKANTPTLEGFLAWLVAGDVEVKRDTETIRDEVRVMTVHGAKGLEADVVFLVDNGMDPAPAAHDPRVLPLAENPDPLSPGPVVWNRSIGAMPERLADRVRLERARAAEEYRRLLYVGMTRAKDWLTVAGIVRKEIKNKPDDRWHALVSRALEPEWEERTDAAGETEYVWRPEVPSTMARMAGPAEAAEVALPAWANAAAPAGPPARARMTPSTALGDTPSPAPGSLANAEQKMALTRGSLLHRLLQSLPDIQTADREAVGARYLAYAADAWTADEQAALLRETLAILDHPDFAPVFGEGSRAEVDMAGQIAGKMVSGRIDRLAVTADRVLIVDFKTNRPVPAAVPPAYVTQLALYRAVLARLYPGRPVAAAILWTERPQLVEVPEAELIRAESTFSGA